MRNLFMERELRKGEALDVSGCKRTKDGDYILPRRMHPPKLRNQDYCDAKIVEWIWSIGRSKRTGEVIASLRSKFYQRPGWECIWLR